MKNLIKNMLDKFGYQLTKNRHSAMRDLLKKNKIDHVIDVGANKGQFSSFIRECNYVGPITAFEPIAELKEIIERQSAATVVSAAVGKNSGKIPINIYSSSDFSSAYELSSKYADDYENVPAIAETRQVDLVSLDDVNFSGKKFLLKIDTQGFDAEVLMGAKNTLEKVDILHLELPFFNIYKNGCTTAEMFKLTESANFCPTRFFPNQITKWGGWVDGDVLFVRKNLL